MCHCHHFACYRKATSTALCPVRFRSPRQEERKIPLYISSVKLITVRRMTWSCCGASRGPRHEEMVDLTDEEITQIARQELDSLLGIKAEPVLTRIYRWVKANPQYDLGHLERVDHIYSLVDSELPGIYLTGSAYRGVGVPDCVRQGTETARQVISSFNFVREAI